MSDKTVVLTGITTTGTPHLGNYVGAIRPSIEASEDTSVQSYYFLADYHALVKCHEPERVHQSSIENAATWLALGLDTDNAIFYRQSDIPEIMELNWMLSCMTAKGLMNRAHAYKGAVAENTERGESDPDKGINMGLFTYPTLMSADILMFNANKVPVGKDQTQHLEMARVIAQRFNHHFGDHFTIPEIVLGEEGAILPGLDGRKMSKSYNNTIPLFLPEKKFRKMIMKIKTNSLEPGEPKDPEECSLFAIYNSLATRDEVAAIRKRYAEGIAWGEMKQFLFEYLNGIFSAPRENYNALMENPAEIEAILVRGAERARDYASPFMQRLRYATGIRPLK
ncbi:MAG: tryptophan--tRNA ligase [Gammaproteobacteria bacterium]|nr:tryptophan--tRNA ligase [Gammaproteobacteria bacterium]